MPQTTLEILHNELSKIQTAQALLVDENGRIDRFQRTKYDLLTEQAKEFKDAIDQWKKWLSQGWFQNN